MLFVKAYVPSYIAEKNTRNFLLFGDCYIVPL